MAGCNEVFSLDRVVWEMEVWACLKLLSELSCALDTLMSCSKMGHYLLSRPVESC